MSDLKPSDLLDLDALLSDDPGNLGPHLLDSDVERLEHPRCEAFFLAQQAEQDVLRADVVVLQRPGLVLGEDDDLPGPFGEAFEHLRPSFLAGRVIVAQLAAAMSRAFTGSLPELSAAARPALPSSHVA